jgi:hypothetical protein
MNTPSYKVVKLTNGEEVICQLSDEIINDEYQLNCPLKMEIRQQMTKAGPMDSLNLSRWIGPYTKQSLFSIKTSHVLLIAEASEGLSRYYEHVMQEIERLDDKDISDNLDNVNDEDVYDELLDESVSSDDTIH